MRKLLFVAAMFVAASAFTSCDFISQKYNEWMGKDSTEVALPIDSAAIDTVSADTMLVDSIVADSLK